MKKVLSKQNLPYWIGAIAVLSVICLALLYFSEAQIPTVSLSSGIVAIISAILGAALVVAVTAILLQLQSDKKVQSKRNVKIYEAKIKEYSEFTKQMWDIVDKNATENDVKNEAINKILAELRKICFGKLPFFLDNEAIVNLARQVEAIKEDRTPTKAADEIMRILQNNLNDEEKNKKEEKEEKEEKNESKNKYPLTELFAAFKELPAEDAISIIEPETAIQSAEQDKDSKHITFWHFIALGNQQFEAFANGNWRLSLIEYGEEWRTNLVKQVKADDVVFLFRRGGYYGYVGAFRVIGKEIFREKDEKTVTGETDMYSALEDGATSVANILVKPLAYNCQGVGCVVARRRTIERMTDAYYYQPLLERFNGKTDSEFGEDRAKWNGYLNDKTKLKDIKNTDVDEAYFKEILSMNNIKS
ncbi:MAG: hypothetical protein LBC68_12880 [Prevotellaceae bacterium]|jgi:hypothetical protein|nr:hypothetical protein [Prevotellaceae bacterium]